MQFSETFKQTENAPAYQVWQTSVSNPKLHNVFFPRVRIDIISLKLSNHKEPGVPAALQFFRASSHLFPTSLANMSLDALYCEDFSFNSHGLTDIIVTRTGGKNWKMVGKKDDHGKK